MTDTPAMVDRSARRRVQVALLVGSATAAAVVLAVLFVSSVFSTANRDRGLLRHRLANLESEFRARTGQEPGPFETPTTVPGSGPPTPTTTATVPRTNRPASTAPVTPAGRSPSTTGTQPSPPTSSAPAPTQSPPPRATTTTTACLAAIGGRCLAPVPPLARSQHFRR